jgi:hypothetical protein
MSYAPAEIYTTLRSRALGIKRQMLGVSEDVFGVVMETGYDETVETLVALGDGSAGFYSSDGGGTLGIDEHAVAADAARSLVSFAGHSRAGLTTASGTPLPTPGHTRFYVLTSRGTLTAQARELDLVQNQHLLSALFHSAHALIAEIRSAGRGIQ